MASIEDFENQLADFGQQLTNLDDILLNVSGQIVAQIKASAPVDEGNLKNSIQAVITDNQIQIQMLAYGLFQNYGVDGMQQRVADPVPFGVEPRPTTGDRFGFSGNYEMIGGDLPIPVRKHIYAYGIKPQRFFNIETITNYIETEVARRLVQDI